MPRVVAFEKLRVEKCLDRQTENSGQPLPYPVGRMRPTLENVTEVSNWAADPFGYLESCEIKDRHLTARDPLTPIRESHESLSANDCESGSLSLVQRSVAKKDLSC
ncbi:hypothetical protein GCM10010471_07730 [Leucobacter komagatae]